MPYITGTEVPLAITFACPRCKANRPGIPAIPGGVQYACGGCEWPMTASQTAAPAAPAVPASTVNATNTSATPIAVTISGGTLTVVTVNGSNVGSTAGTYIVPALGTINITYSVAPTWTWALPGISGAVSAGALALPIASGGTYYAAGMVLVVDGGAVSEVVTVTGTPTGTSVPVTALNNAHIINTTFAVASFNPALSGVGLENVPPAPGWGY